MKWLKKNIFKGILLLAVLYIILLIPDADAKKNIVQPKAKPFIWNKNLFWSSLENQFATARVTDSITLDSVVKKLQTEEDILYTKLSLGKQQNVDSLYTTITNLFFELAPYIAVRQKHLNWYLKYYTAMRNLVKQQSQLIDMSVISNRNRIYRILYGMRAATEEVILQSAPSSYDAALFVNNTLSATPSTNIFGIPVHSGDLLVSRGGAEVSALISRGNDYPGNFSHVALIYVDDKDNTPYLIEAHIEKGVAVSSAAQYVKDQKLRFMVMRMRSDLPAILQDPLLPHKAAKAAYTDALQRHIPYDFKMDFVDSSKMFCSEVGSCAYKKTGIQLWKSNSTISSQGIVNWLNAFGVENFVTQMPSDLEYDPQLNVVAEWRNPETLFKDHVDNAVMDALLARADKGTAIGYNHWQLPFIRCVKAWCSIKNYFGKEGPIPEGMSATQALKNLYFIDMNNKVKTQLKPMIDDFIKQHHYNPPYWQLVKMAELAASDL